MSWPRTVGAVAASGPTGTHSSATSLSVPSPGARKRALPAGVDGWIADEVELDVVLTHRPDTGLVGADVERDTERAEAVLRMARGRAPDDEPWRPLTSREFEVARLIGE